MAVKPKYKKKTESKIKNLFNSRNLPYLIPALYFAIMTIISFTYHKIGDYAVETDFYWAYIPQAEEILDGRLEIDAYRGPIYQVVLAFVGLVFGKDFFSAGMFINLLAAALVLFFVYRIVDTLAGWKIAALTTLFVSVNTYFLQLSYSCGTDMLFMMFYFLAIYYLFKPGGSKLKNIFLAGVFTGIAYLTRYTGLAPVISIAIILLITVFKREEMHGRRSLDFKPLLYFLAPVLILIFAWGLICLSIKGSFFVNDNYLNTAFIVYKPPPMPNDEWTYIHAPAFKSMFDVVSKDFGLFFKRIFIDNFTGFYVSNMSVLLPVFMGIAVSLGILIFIVFFRQNSFNEKCFFLISFVFYLFPLLAFYSERFMIPLLPFYFYMVFRAANYRFVKKIADTVIKKYAVALLAAAAFGLTFYDSYSFIRDDIDIGPNEILMISDNLKKHYKYDLTARTTMARKPHIAYYTNTKFVSIPYVKTYEDLIKAVKDARADFLYISYIEVKNMGRQFKFLQDYENCPKELAVMIYTKNPNSVLYRLKTEEELKGK
jgi:hypothetical protein